VEGRAVACRCCPGGIGRTTRVPRYPSDISDAEWQVIQLALPALAWKAGKGGRPAATQHGSVLNGKDGQEQETLVLQQFRRRF
jgi:hypothetical protein